MNRTLTNNYFIILIADVRDRQLQIFVTRLGGKCRRPSLTNIQATRRSLQRDPYPDHSPLWFLSLVISLFCSLLATVQQRWARRYLQVTQPQVAMHERARIRSYFAEGMTRIRVSVTVEAIPALLHISVSSPWQAPSFPSSQSTTPSRTSPSPRQPSAPLCTPPSR
jgi:hypothetical protein